MSQYTKSTNFATKDNLSPGDPLKIVRGTEIDTEFNNIATAIATKTDNSAAAITGGSITGITDLAIADGGTGASTATAAINNLLPSQTSNANKYLQTDGTNVSWDAVSLSTSDITGTLPVANGGTGVTSSTGTGSVVLSNSPTLVTPALGTPASGVATNLTGLPISTGVSGLGTGVATFLGTPSSANLASAVSDETGSGALVFANSPTLVTPALGTPSSGTLTNATGLPISTGVSGLGTGVATFLGTPSSANLRSALTDETGTGSAVFATSPALVTPDLGTPSAATLTNATGLPISTGVSGLGTGVATALAVNVGSAGAPVVNGGALGTPSSGTVTNLTGTASININGTVGATTPTTGAFTTLSASSSVTLSGGTANGVTYLNGSKVLTSGSALTFDGTNLTVANGDITIATNGKKLYVNYIANNSGTDLNINGATNQIFSIASSEQMRLTSTGLGIGTSSPLAKLDVVVNGSAQVTAIKARSNNAGTLAVGDEVSLDFQWYSSSYYGGRISGYIESLIGNGKGGLKFYTSSNGTSINTTPSATLDSSGNLGLGVTPSAWGFGNAIQAGSTSNLWDATGGTVYLTNNAYFDGGNWRRQTANYASFYRQINGGHDWNIAGTSSAGSTISFTQGMVLDASGNLLVGTTSASVGSVTGMKVVGSGSRLELGGTDSTNSGIGFDMYSTGAAAYRFYVGYGGTIYATSTTITAISDQRLKENIRDLDDGLATVMALKPRKFDWKTGKGKDIKNDRGFIAQEFETVLPDMIEEWRDPAPEGEEAYKAVNANLIPTLVKAIQELKSEFDAYKAAHP